MMAVHVDEMVSDVTTEAAPPTAAASATVTWQELEQMREAHAQMVRDQRRTEAEGYDD